MMNGNTADTGEKVSEHVLMSSLNVELQKGETPKVAYLVDDPNSDGVIRVLAESVEDAVNQVNDKEEK